MPFSVRPGLLRAVGEDVGRHGHDQRRGHPTHLRKLVCGVALDVLGEGPPHLLRGRLLVVERTGTLRRPHVLGSGEGEEGFAEHLGLNRRQRERSPGEAVADGVHPELGLLAGPFFLLGELLRLVGFGAVGVDGLEEPFTEQTQLVGVEVRCLADQERLRFGCLGGVVVVEVVEGSSDHGCLLGQHLPGCDCLAGLRVRVQGGRELAPTVRFTPRHPGRAGQPLRHRAGADRAVQVEGVRLGEQSGLDLGQPGEVGDQPGHRLGGVLGVQRPHRGVLDVVQAGLEGVEETEDRVTRPGVVEVPAHGATQAPATDTQDATFALNHGDVENFFGRLGCGGLVGILRGFVTLASLAAQPPEGLGVLAEHGAEVVEAIILVGTAMSSEPTSPPDRPRCVARTSSPVNPTVARRLAIGDSRRRSRPPEER